jgi:hypothetical protein
MGRPDLRERVKENIIILKLLNVQQEANVLTKRSISLFRGHRVTIDFIDFGDPPGAPPSWR